MTRRLATLLDSIKIWFDGFAQKPNALWFLFGVAFVEGSFFPLSVDVPLVALGVTSPRKSLVYALVATLGSFVGGYLGYLIGYEFYDAVGKPLLQAFGLFDTVESTLHAYREHGVSTLMFAGFTPLPYISFTITAGFNKSIDLWTLTIGSLLGRTLRFFLVGGILYIFGEKAKPVLEKSFKMVSVVFLFAVVLGLIIFKWIG